MTLSTAISYIDDYVNGTKTSTNSYVSDAIAYLATNGHYAPTAIAAYGITVNGYSADRFDNQILAFCNYWYNKYSSLGYKYNPMYVKAMIAVETKLGTYEGSRHGTTDIMQCLDKDNPSVYCMAKIAPTNGVPYSSAEGLSYGMKSAGYTFVRNIFSGSTPSSSKYSSFISLCSGILWLGYKTAVKGSLQDGVIAYNGGGDPDYWDKVYSCYLNPVAYLS